MSQPVVLVTGASSGIGESTAIKLAAQGAIAYGGLKSIFETDFKRHSEPRLPSTAQINH